MVSVDSFNNALLITLIFKICDLGKTSKSSFHEKVVRISIVHIFNIYTGNLLD